jgi:hypothetical protein
VPCFSPLDDAGAITVTRPLIPVAAWQPQRHRRVAIAHALVTVVKAVVGGFALAIACAVIGAASLLGG